MRVILNVDAITPPLTGIGRYALELARGLRDAEDVDDVRFYSAYRWLNSAEAALGANAVLASLRQHLPLKSLALRGYFWMRQRAFDRLAKQRYRNYLLHSPNYMLFRHVGPSIATLHDFSWVHFPEYHPRERIDLMRREMPRTYRQATAFITDSEFVKREAMQLAGLASERIHVVPLGVDPAYRPMAPTEIGPTLIRHGLEAGQYLLAVSTLEPRKNLVRLLQAYGALEPSLRSRFPLVLVGVRGWHAESIECLATRLEATGDLRRLGYVPESDLPAIYGGARAFAFVSLHEGFGLPPLEAMASGVPVLCSNATSLPEVVGDAARLVDPLDESAIRQGLEQVLTDDPWREAAVAAGLARATAFTWQRCVRETLQVYRKVVAT